MLRVSYKGEGKQRRAEGDRGNVNKNRKGQLKKWRKE